MHDPVGYLPDVSVAVVGVQHPNADGSNRRFAISLCAPGEPVYLRLEPTNPVDPYAIAVFNGNDMQMGYVIAVRAQRIGDVIREGRDWRAVFQKSTEFGAWIRMSFDGEDPALTPAMIAASAELPDTEGVDAESDFYPDEIWPDD